MALCHIFIFNGAIWQQLSDQLLTNRYIIISVFKMINTIGGKLKTQSPHFLIRIILLIKNMTSRDRPTTSSSLKYKQYYAKKKRLAELSLIQSRVAYGLSYIIQRMLNKNMQNECLSLLHADDLEDVEARIYFLLQQVDMDIEKENTPQDRNSHNVRQQDDDDRPTTSKRARH